MQPINVIDIRSFFGGARILRSEPKEEPTMLLLFKSGKLDLSSLTGQNLRDLWCLLLGNPTGRKTSPGLQNKKMLIMRCIELGDVMHLYPEV